MLNATVKRSQGTNIGSLVERIESNPRRRILENDLQPQHQSFVPFSEESKKLIKEAGNIELSEMINVAPQIQCKGCLAYCNAGLTYCQCGHFLCENTTMHKPYVKAVLDLISIKDFYIRKNRPHGYRYGKAEGAQQFHTAKQLRKKCLKKKYTSIHDRFINDLTFRKNMTDMGRDEKFILSMDELAQEDHTHYITEEEKEFYRNNWWIHANVSTSDSMPVRHRPGFQQALLTLRRLKQEEDDKYYQDSDGGFDRSGQPVTSTPSNYWSHSSSSSWWQWHDSWWHS